MSSQENSRAKYNLQRHAEIESGGEVSERTEVMMMNALSVLWIVSMLVGMLCEFPPQNIPEEMLQRYTMNGEIPLEKFYIDDSNQGEGTHFKYTRKGIDRFIDSAKTMFSKVNAQTGTLPRNLWVYKGLLDNAKYIENQDVCVFGSMEPWVEAGLLALGATRVVTVDYNHLTYDHPSIETIAQDRFQEFYDINGPYHHAFTFCVSASSFDHDGLGRYGDPLNADGDLEAMALVRRVLSPHGRLLLTVPIGPDLVVFNLMRRYGPVRLPRLLEGWGLVGGVAWDEEKLSAPASYRLPYEPVLVLQPTQEQSDAPIEVSASQSSEL